VTGPDGNLWFTESAGNKIGRLTTSGSFTEFPLPTAGAVPWGITVGPDGALWFVESFGFKVGRITTGGAVTEFPLPTTNSYPRAITRGPDGNLWFTEEGSFKVGRITPAGAITEFPVPATSDNQQGIATGPDGRLWFSINLACEYAIGSMGTDGSFREIFVPGFCSQPQPVMWSGETIWFGTVINDGVWRRTPGRRLDRIPTPTVDSDPMGIAMGSDGAIWFTEYFGNKIGRISP
jgi:streptogramin lyase